MTHSWCQRRIVTTDSTNTIADGVAGRRPFPAVLDDLLLVTDDAVLFQEVSITAQRYLDDLDAQSLTGQIDSALGHLHGDDEAAVAAVAVGHRVLDAVDDEW